jgi:mannose-1-phosphate guanylyltransferase
VLVGGEGTRLRPLTYTTPKQLLPVAGVAMIERVVGHLAGHGVDEVVLSMGYLPDAFHLAFPDDRCAGARLVYAVEPEPLDTGGAIAFAARAAGIDDTFVVRNGDVLTDLDVTALVGRHRATRAAATIALTRVDDPSAFGVVPTDGTGRVTAFVEKPPPGQAPTDLINAGIYVVEPGVLDRIPAGRRVSVERETFPSLVADGTLYAMACDGWWVDAGTPATYLRANLDLLPGGQSLLGDGAVVAPGARVERSVVGAGARVEAGAEVRGSVLLPGAVVRAGATVADSIVGEGAVVGEGAALAAHAVVGGRVEVEPRRCLAGERLPAA